MKRVITSFLATVAGLVALLSFKTHTPAVEASTTTATSSGSSSSSSNKTSTATKTYTGDSVTTRWGPVQVQITATGSKITAVDVIEYPQENNRDVQINAYAVPTLVSEALSAQSANVDTVSGATYTTEGFTQSLQSAIAQLP